MILVGACDDWYPTETAETEATFAHAQMHTGATMQTIIARNGGICQIRMSLLAILY